MLPYCPALLIVIVVAFTYSGQISDDDDGDMLGSRIAMWQICCTTGCRIVVSLSVGGVINNTTVAGVRVVEFGTKRMN